MVYYHHVAYHYRSSRKKAGAGKPRSPSPLPSLSSRPAGPPLCSTSIPKRPPASGAPAAPPTPHLCLLCNPPACRAPSPRPRRTTLTLSSSIRLPGPSTRRWKPLVSPTWSSSPAARNSTTSKRSRRRCRSCRLRAACPPSLCCRGWPPAAHGTDQARTALTSSGLRVCPATLGYRAVVGDAGALGLTATEFQPRGLAAQEARHVAQWITEILATGGTPDG